MLKNTPNLLKFLHGDWGIAVFALPLTNKVKFRIELTADLLCDTFAAGSTFDLDPNNMVFTILPSFSEQIIAHFIL